MTGPQAEACTSCGAEFPPDALFCPMCGQPAPKQRAKNVAQTDTLIGKLIGDRYLLQDRIGDGGSGVIYRAEHITLRRPVALKLLHHKLSKDDLAIERFRREATTVAEIDNDHVVKVFDFGRSPDGRLFFAMEFLEGETLAQIIARDGKIAIPRVVDILTQVCEALMEAHAMGYVHRDLRPGNIFLTTRRGRKDFVKLLDFGLAKLLTPGGEASQTTLGMTFGDPRYMSPEQARGQILDRRSDIYALGIIGYEMLCGKPPFGGQKTLDVLQKQLEVIPTPPSAVRKDVPTWLEAVVLRALAKRPDDRFVTVMRMIEEMKKGEAQGTPAAPPNFAATLLPPSADAQRDALAVFGRDTIPDPKPPTFEPEFGPLSPPPAPSPAVGATVELTAQSDPFANAPDTAPDPLPKIPEPVAMGSVATVNSPPPTTEPVTASQQFFQAAASQAQAPAASASLSLPIESQWDEEPIKAGPSKALVITVAGLGAVLVGLGVWMFWPRKVAAPQPRPVLAEAPRPAPPPVAAAAPPPIVQPLEPPKPQPKAEPIAEPSKPAKPAAKAAAKKESTKLAATAPAPERPRPEPAKPESPRVEPPKPLAKATPPRVVPPRPGKTASPDQPLDPYQQPAATPSPPSADDAQAEGYIKMGRLFLQRQDYAKAVAAFNRAREFDPRNADAISGLGQVAYHQSKYEDAAVHFREAVRLSPNRASFHVWLGHSLLGGGHPREAEAEYKAALQLEPNNGPARQGLEAAQKR